MPLSRSRFIAATGALTALGTAPAFAQAGPVIRMAGVATESYAEPLYGLDGGFFAKAGLNVEIQTFGSGGAIANAVAGNALDIGIADTIAVGNGILRGLPFAFFAGGMEYVSEAPTSQLCVAANGPVRGPKDLEGQTIGVNGLKSMAELATREWLRTNGVDIDRVKFVEIPPSAVIAAVSRGTIAAVVISEPNLTAAGSDVRRLAKTFDWCAKRFYINCWFANRDWLAKNPETARKLVGAIYETARWANVAHNETSVILAKWAKMDVDKIRDTTRAVYATALDPKLMQPVIDLAVRYKVMEKTFPASDLIVRV